LFICVYLLLTRLVKVKSDDLFTYELRRYSDTGHKSAKTVFVIKWPFGVNARQGQLCEITAGLYKRQFRNISQNPNQKNKLSQMCGRHM